LKKLLSAVLALAMLLSLCACGGDKDKAPDGSTNPVSQSDSLQENITDGSDDDDASTPPEKVEGDRVPVGGAGGAPKHVESNWKVGEVDANDVMNEKRLPIDLTTTKMTFGFGEETGPAHMKMVFFADKGEYKSFEIETASNGMTMLSRFFKVDEQEYFFTSANLDGESEEKLYKIVETADETTDGDKNTDGDESTASSEPVGDSSGVADEDFSMSPEDITSQFGGSFDITDSSTADNIVSCEYIGQKDGEDMFKVVTTDGYEGNIYIDHETGWVVGMILKATEQSTNTSAELAQLGSVNIRIEYDAKDTIVMDVTDAVEDDGSSVMFLFAQIMSLATTPDENGDFSFNIPGADSSAVTDGDTAGDSSAVVDGDTAGDSSSTGDSSEVAE